uniref:Uncharacterized protein n=1 Tax=viral metagenome TaxID=1070528 RepID=A0A2V0R909_9ZZZZ
MYNKQTTNTMANRKQPGFVPGIPLGNPFNPGKYDTHLTKISNRPGQNLQLRPNPVQGYKGNQPALKMAEPMGQSKTSRKTRNKSQDRDKAYTPPEFSQSSSFSTSEDFTKDGPDVGRTGLFPERRSGPIHFDYFDSMPLSVMQLEDNYTTLLYPAGDTVNNTPKMCINIGNYHRNFSVTGTAWNRHLNVIFNRYSRDIISTVRSKIVDDWTQANFYGYMENTCQLIEAFYFIDSILSYEGSSDKKDRNPVLLEMKNEFSQFNILAKHDEARRILKNCWFPDKFSSLIAWTYQNYKSGQGDQCCNYKCVPHERLTKNPNDANFQADQLVTYYDSLISNVTTVQNRNIISLLCQTFPQGRIGNLPLSCSESVYDYNHYEFFINQGIIWPASATGFGNLAGFPNNDDYNLYSSELSAEDAGCFPFVLNSTWDNVANEFTNGCFIPRPRLTLQNGSFMSQVGWSYVTNKFYAFNDVEGSDSYKWRSRNIKEYSTVLPVSDTHLMRTDDTAANPEIGVAGCNSMSKGHFQNLYFNTNDSRILVMREFLNSLFYIK